jgi:hypothetical protein
MSSDNWLMGLQHTSQQCSDYKVDRVTVRQMRNRMLSGEDQFSIQLDGLRPAKVIVLMIVVSIKRFGVEWLLQCRDETCEETIDVVFEDIVSEHTSSQEKA